jgi:hypothetical protein
MKPLGFNSLFLASVLLNLGSLNAPAEIVPDGGTWILCARI